MISAGKKDLFWPSELTLQSQINLKKEMKIGTEIL